MDEDRKKYYRTLLEMREKGDLLDTGYPLYSVEVLNHPLKILANNCDYLSNKVDKLYRTITPGELGQGISYSGTIVNAGMSYKQALLALDNALREIHMEIMNRMYIDVSVQLQNYTAVLEPTTLPLDNAVAVISKGNNPQYYYGGSYFYDAQGNQLLNVGLSYCRGLYAAASQLYIFGANPDRQVDLQNNNITSLGTNSWDFVAVKESGQWRILGLYFNDSGIKYWLRNFTGLSIVSSDHTVFLWPDGGPKTPAIVGTRSGILNAFSYLPAGSNNSHLKVFFPYVYNSTHSHVYFCTIPDISNPGLGDQATLFFSADPETGNDVDLCKCWTLHAGGKLLLIISYKDVGEGIFKTAFYLSDDFENFTLIGLKSHFRTHSAGYLANHFALVAEDYSQSGLTTIYHLKLRVDIPLE